MHKLLTLSSCHGLLGNRTRPLNGSRNRGWETCARRPSCVSTSCRLCSYASPRVANQSRKRLLIAECSTSVSHSAASCFTRSTRPAKSACVARSSAALELSSRQCVSCCWREDRAWDPDYKAGVRRFEQVFIVECSAPQYWPRAVADCRSWLRRPRGTWRTRCARPTRGSLRLMLAAEARDRFV